MEPSNAGGRVCRARDAATATANAPGRSHDGRRVTPAEPTAFRIATAADLPFVLSLQKRWSNQLGFLPTAAVEHYIAIAGVRLCLENGEPSGYLLSPARLRCLPSTRPLIQTAICLDAQRHGHALQLVELTAAAAIDGGCSMLQAWCRADIEATAFWAAAGFTGVALRKTANARQHPLLLFRRILVSHGESSPLHIPRRSGCRGTTTANARLLTAADRRRLGLTPAEVITADIEPPAGHGDW